VKRLSFLLFAILLVIATPLAANEGDIDTLLDLLDAGVSEASIQRYVEKSQLTFQLSAKDLVELKKAGASDTLIEYLQGRDVEILPESESVVIEPEDAQTQPIEEEVTEAGGTSTVVYDSPNVTFGFGIGFGFGYPHFYSAYYSPYYYYPYYHPYHYPYYSAYPYHPSYPCYYGSTVVGPGGRSAGTGVYSYWYDNQVSGRPTPTREPGASSSAALSGRVLRTAPPPATAPAVGGTRDSAARRGAASTSPRSPASDRSSASDGVARPRVPSSPRESARVSSRRPASPSSAPEPRAGSRMGRTSTPAPRVSGPKPSSPRGSVSSAPRSFPTPRSAAAPRSGSRMGSAIPRASIGTSPRALSPPRSAPSPRMSAPRASSPRSSVSSAPRSSSPRSSFRGGGGASRGGGSRGGGRSGGRR